MNLWRFLLDASRPTLGLVLFATLAGGLGNAAVLATLNHALHARREEMGLLALAFTLAAAVRLLTGLVSQVALARFAQEAVARLRRELVASILLVPYAQVERLGAARLTATLSEDALHISNGVLGLPNVLLNAGMLACGGLYLAWLSWRVLLATAVFVAAGAVVHRFLMRSGLRFLNLARDEQDRLFASFRALTEGMKELKLSEPRRALFLEHGVDRVTRAYSDHSCAAETRFIASASFSSGLFLALVGALVFLVPHFGALDAETLSGFVIACPFLMGPLGAVLSSFSWLGRASVALTRVQALGDSLRDRADREPLARGAPIASPACIELAGVSHTYRREGDDRPFQIGPIDLTLSRGELVFLVGGNGSGKSTLAKLLTGLYAPEGGCVMVDGRVIGGEDRDRYRQLFSAVFCDFYLFEDLLAVEDPERLALARQYLAQLRLDGQVRIEGGRLSTTSLSTGQRKRLALLAAYLEDRPFYLFDEWAADQDPEFKELFYSTLLPELRSRGKGVLVITHDDRWFPLADRLLKLESGRMTGPQALPSALRAS